jgi:hypothetical protein
MAKADRPVMLMGEPLDAREARVNTPAENAWR